MDERVEAMARRLDALAGEIKWHRRGSVALVLLLAAAASTPGLAAARGAPRELQARRFVLVAGDGTPLAALEAGPQDLPRLTLSSAGAARAELGLDSGGAPALRLLGPKGERRIALELSGDEARVAVRSGTDGTTAALSAGGAAPRLAVADAKGNERLWLAVRLGSPVVQFLDERGFARTGLSTFNGDTGVAVVSQADGKAPGLVLLGKEHNVVWSAP